MSEINRVTAKDSMMTNYEIQLLKILLRKFRDDAVDRAEYDARELVRFDVECECEARGLCGKREHLAEN